MNLLVINCGLLLEINVFGSLRCVKIFLRMLMVVVVVVEDMCIIFGYMECEFIRMKYICFLNGLVKFIWIFFYGELVYF